MMKFETILVGLDLNGDGDAVTSGAHKATQQAIWVAKAYGSSIRLVHSTRPDESLTPLRGSRGIVHEGLPESGRLALEGLVAEVKASGLQVELVITSDRPWLDITKMVLQGGVDLVVVGKRSEPSDDGRRLGSIAAKLLRKCPCPVWVVRPEHDLVHRLVLAATDLSEVGNLVVQTACDVAQHHGCELHVVHAWQMPMTMQMDASHQSEDAFAEEIEAAKQEVIAKIAALLPAENCPANEIHTARGAPAQIIREAVSHLDPDLLVMGTLSRSGIAGFLIGSTAERMLDQVTCSILALKPEGFESPVRL
ncbi:MAG: universal stress protein E [Candidatus Paceibacteria bacterium]|jgi:universal stress protein E